MNGETLPEGYSQEFNFVNVNDEAFSINKHSGVISWKDVEQPGDKKLQVVVAIYDQNNEYVGKSSIQEITISFNYADPESVVASFDESGKKMVGTHKQNGGSSYSFITSVLPDNADQAVKFFVEPTQDSPTFNEDQIVVSDQKHIQWKGDLIPNTYKFNVIVASADHLETKTEVTGFELLIQKSVPESITISYDGDSSSNAIVWENGNINGNFTIQSNYQWDDLSVKYDFEYIDGVKDVLKDLTITNGKISWTSINVVGQVKFRVKATSIFNESVSAECQTDFVLEVTSPYELSYEGSYDFYCTKDQAESESTDETFSIVDSRSNLDIDLSDFDWTVECADHEELSQYVKMDTDTNKITWSAFPEIGHFSFTITGKVKTAPTVTVSLDKDITLKCWDSCYIPHKYFAYETTSNGVGLTGIKNDAWSDPNVNNWTTLCVPTDADYIKEGSVDSKYGAFMSINDNSNKITEVIFDQDSKYTIIPTEFCGRNFYIEKITIPEGITRINRKAFIRLYSIKEFNLPNSLTVLDMTDDDCGQFGWIKPINSDKTIADFDFVLPNKVIGLTNQMFVACTRMRSISLGTNIQHIDSQAFAGCCNLKIIYLDGWTQPANWAINGSNQFYSFSDSELSAPAVPTIGKFIVRNGTTDQEILTQIKAWFVSKWSSTFTNWTIEAN